MKSKKLISLACVLCWHVVCADDDNDAASDPLGEEIEEKKQELNKSYQELKELLARAHQRKNLPREYKKHLHRLQEHVIGHDLLK